MNREQFWQHLEPWHGELEAFCHKLAGSRDDGADLYQNVLLAGCRQVERLRDPGALRAWLYRIAVNTFKNSRRDRARRAAAHEAAVQESTPHHNPWRQQQARLWLERALNILSAEDKALVLLFEVEGWTIAELAAMLHKRPGTIKSRLSRARARLRSELLKLMPQPQKLNLTSEGSYAMPKTETSPE